MPPRVGVEGTRRRSLPGGGIGLFADVESSAQCTGWANTLRGVGGSRLLPELEQFELIGQGGMGVVYRARHRKHERPVAVEVLNSPEQQRLICRAIRSRSALGSARPSERGVGLRLRPRDDLSYLIMELIDGVNLSQTLWLIMTTGFTIGAGRKRRGDIRPNPPEAFLGSCDEMVISTKAGWDI